MRLSKHLPRITLSLLLSAFGALTSVSAVAQQSNDSNLGDAQHLLKQGQYASALAKADTYVNDKPKDPQGRFLKGLILTEMKRTQEAIQVFKKLTEDFPELPEPYNNLAVLYAQEKQYEKARQALESAIKTHPAYAVAHENLGDIYAKLASQAYGKALQIDAGNSTAQTKMAMIRDLIPTTTAVVAASKPPGKQKNDPIRLSSVDPNRLTGPGFPAPVAPHPLAIAPKVTTQPVAPPITTPPAPPPTTALVAAPLPKPAIAQNQGAKPAAEQNPGKAIRDWANAWSNKDVKSYLAAYAPDFQTPNGQARKAWENERQARITKPGKIEVGIEKIVVNMNGNDKATVKFRQNYRSANLRSSTAKTVILTKHNDRWMILQERVN